MPEDRACTPLWISRRFWGNWSTTIYDELFWDTWISDKSNLLRQFQHAYPCASDEKPRPLAWPTTFHQNVWKNHPLSPKKKKQLRPSSHISFLNNVDHVIKPRTLNHNFKSPNQKNQKPGISSLLTSANCYALLEQSPQIFWTKKSQRLKPPWHGGGWPSPCHGEIGHPKDPPEGDVVMNHDERWYLATWLEFCCYRLVKYKIPRKKSRKTRKVIYDIYQRNTRYHSPDWPRLVWHVSQSENFDNTELAFLLVELEGKPLRPRHDRFRQRCSGPALSLSENAGRKWAKAKHHTKPLVICPTKWCKQLQTPTVNKCACFSIDAAVSSSDAIPFLTHLGKQKINVTIRWTHNDIQIKSALRLPSSFAQLDKKMIQLRFMPDVQTSLWVKLNQETQLWTRHASEHQWWILGYMWRFPKIGVPQNPPL